LNTGCLKSATIPVVALDLVHVLKPSLMVWST